jgi:hypothetical protein
LVFFVSKYNDTGLCTIRFAVGVRFDGVDAHCGNSFDTVFLHQALVFGLVNFIIRVKSIEAIILFLIRFEPSGIVG